MSVTANACGERKLVSVIDEEAYQRTCMEANTVSDYHKLMCLHHTSMAIGCRNDNRKEKAAKHNAAAEYHRKQASDITE